MQRRIATRYLLWPVVHLTVTHPLPRIRSCDWLVIPSGSRPLCRLAESVVYTVNQACVDSNTLYFVRYRTCCFLLFPEYVPDREGGH